MELNKNKCEILLHKKSIILYKIPRTKQNDIKVNENHIHHNFFLVDIDKRICPMNTLLDSQSKQRKEKSVF
jgi:hypothetical protein